MKALILYFTHRFHILHNCTCTDQVGHHNKEKKRKFKKKNENYIFDDPNMGGRLHTAIEIVKESD